MLITLLVPGSSLQIIECWVKSACSEASKAVSTLSYVMLPGAADPNMFVVNQCCVLLTLQSVFLDPRISLLPCVLSAIHRAKHKGSHAEPARSKSSGKDRGKALPSKLWGGKLAAKFHRIGHP
jgi:hypothetical protein